MVNTIVTKKGTTIEFTVFTVQTVTQEFKTSTLFSCDVDSVFRDSKNT